MTFRVRRRFGTVRHLGALRERSRLSCRFRAEMTRVRNHTPPHALFPQRQRQRQLLASNYTLQTRVSAEGGPQTTASRRASARPAAEKGDERMAEWFYLHGHAVDGRHGASQAAGRRRPRRCHVPSVYWNPPPRVTIIEMSMVSVVIYVWPCHRGARSQPAAVNRAPSDRRPRCCSQVGVRVGMERDGSGDSAAATPQMWSTGPRLPR